MRNRYGIGYFLAFVITGILFAGLFFGCSPSNKKVDEAGKYVLKALKAKYKKDFVIDSGHYISNTGGYEFKVYPKNDPDFTFNAWLNGMTENGESDDYFLSLRIEQGKKLVAPYIRAISKDYYIDAVGTGPNPDMKNYEDAVADVHNNMLSINQQLNKYPYNIVIDARIFINYNIAPANEDSVFKKVYKLIEFLKEKKFGIIRISLSFYDFPGKSIKKLGEKEGVNFNLNYFEKAKYVLVIIPSDIKNIHNYKDIKRIHNEVMKKYKRYKERLINEQ